MAHQNEVVGLAASSQGEELFLAAADGVVVEGPGGHKVRRSDGSVKFSVYLGDL